MEEVKGSNGNVEYVEGQKILRKVELWISEDNEFYILSKDSSGNKVLKRLYVSGGYNGALPDLIVGSVDRDTPYVLLDEEDEIQNGK